MSNKPAKAKTKANVEAAKDEAKLNFAMLMRVWWAVAWRTGLVFFLIGSIILLLDDYTRLLERYSGDQINLTMLVLMVPITIWATSRALNKNYGNVRLSLHVRDGANDNEKNKKKEPSKKENKEKKAK